jgi:hypothetical protein
MKRVCIIILAVLALVIIFASSRREGHDIKLSAPATLKANFTPNVGGACPGSPSTGPTPAAGSPSTGPAPGDADPPATVAEPEIELDLGLGYPQGTIGTGLLSPGNKRVSVGAGGTSIASTVLGTGQTPTKSSSTGTSIAYGLLKYLALPPRVVLFHPP